MIRMDLAEPPLRGIKPLSDQREKKLLLLLLEDDPGPLAGGSMDAQPGGFLTPPNHLLLDMLPVAKAFSFEEILPDIGDLPFYGRFGVVRRLHKVRNMRNDFFG